MNVGANNEPGAVVFRFTPNMPKMERIELGKATKGKD